MYLWGHKHMTSTHVGERWLPKIATKVDVISGFYKTLIFCLEFEYLCEFLDFCNIYIYIKQIYIP